MQKPDLSSKRPYESTKIHEIKHNAFEYKSCNRILAVGLKQTTQIRIQEKPQQLPLQCNYVQYVSFWPFHMTSVVLNSNVLQLRNSGFEQMALYQQLLTLGSKVVLVLISTNQSSRRHRYTLSHSKYSRQNLIRHAPIKNFCTPRDQNLLSKSPGNYK